MKKKEIKFNLNYNVRVKLTDVGRQRLADIHNKYVGTIPGYKIVTSDSYKKDEDKDGYTRMQAWCMMQDFGDMMGMCRPQPFHLDIILELDS